MHRAGVHRVPVDDMGLAGSFVARFPSFLLAFSRLSGREPRGLACGEGESGSVKTFTYAVHDNPVRSPSVKSNKVRENNSPALSTPLEVFLL